MHQKRNPVSPILEGDSTDPDGVLPIDLLVVTGVVVDDQLLTKVLDLNNLTVLTRRFDEVITADEDTHVVRVYPFAEEHEVPSLAKARVDRHAESVKELVAVTWHGVGEDGLPEHEVHEPRAVEPIRAVSFMRSSVLDRRRTQESGNKIQKIITVHYSIPPSGL